jgi:carboxyl-terminal processing protease
MKKYSHLALLVMVLSTAPLVADDLWGKRLDAESLLNEAAALVDKLFVHKSILKKYKWQQIKERYRKKARGVRGPAQSYAIINEMLGQLKTSHLVLMNATVYQRHLRNEFHDAKAPMLGFEMFDLKGRLHIVKILEDSAADKAGLKVGDEILGINQFPAMDSDKLFSAGHDPGLPGPHGYVILVDKGEAISLKVRSQLSGPTRTVSVKAYQGNQLQAISASVRIIKHRSYKVGVIHLWHLLHKSVVPVVSRALTGKFKDADAVILDIRGRGGYSHLGEQIIDFFEGKKAIWKKPVIVLNHKWTRSAKEIFSYSWRRRKAGLIIGERTRGAVYGTIFRRLKDGSWLLIPRSSSTKRSGGLSLELRGVAPDIYVSQGGLAYRQGRDLILLRGLRVLEYQIKGQKIPEDWLKPGPMPAWAKIY